MRSRKLTFGNVKVALYPERLGQRGAWIPSDAQEEALLELGEEGAWGVEEVASCGAQSYHVTLDFENVKAFRQHFDSACSTVLAVLA